jgi:hypothetical protein
MQVKRVAVANSRNHFVGFASLPDPDLKSIFAGGGKLPLHNSAALRKIIS